MSRGSERGRREGRDDLAPHTPRCAYVMHVSVSHSILGLGSPILTRNALDGLCSVAISYKCGSAILFLVVDLILPSTPP